MNTTAFDFCCILAESSKSALLGIVAVLGIVGTSCFYRLGANCHSCCPTNNVWLPRIFHEFGKISNFTL